LDKLAKSDKPEQSTELEPVSSDPNSKAKQFKGELSGKDIQTIPMEGGGQIYGTVHRNRKMVDDIINHIKATIPEEKWKDIVFVGEGGSTNDSGELVFNDEMKYAAPKFKQLGAGIDTFDGDELDVHDDQSKLYKRQIEKTGFNQSQVKAGNWASMIGQGEGTDTMSPNDYLDNEGKKFLQDEAVNAGLARPDRAAPCRELERNLRKKCAGRFLRPRRPNHRWLAGFHGSVGTNVWTKLS
jgi:hypothetical protein